MAYRSPLCPWPVCTFNLDFKNKVHIIIITCPRVPSGGERWHLRYILKICIEDCLQKSLGKTCESWRTEIHASSMWSNASIYRQSSAHNCKHENKAAIFFGIVTFVLSLPRTNPTHSTLCYLYDLHSYPSGCESFWGNISFAITSTWSLYFLIYSKTPLSCALLHCGFWYTLCPVISPTTIPFIFFVKSLFQILLTFFHKQFHSNDCIWWVTLE